MAKHQTILILSIITLAFCGLIGIQFFWINNALDVQKKLLQENVNHILTELTKELERDELIQFVNDEQFFSLDTSRIDIDIFTDTIVPTFVTENIQEVYHTKRDSLIPYQKRIRAFKQPLAYQSSFSYRYIPDSTTVNHSKIRSYRLNNAPHLQFESEDMIDRLRMKTIQDKLNTARNRQRDIEREHSLKTEKRAQKNQNVQFYPTDNLPDIILKKYVTELVHEPRPILERLNNARVLERLKNSFDDKKFDLAYKFAVQAKDSVFFYNHQTGLVDRFKGIPENSWVSKADYRVKLFPNDVIFNENYLLLSFPEENKFIYSQVFGMIALSFVFISVLIGGFWFTVHTIFKQKKLSELKNDFINNMTHELKTPISTISLATEGILNPAIIQKPEKLDKYARVIKDENQRLSDQVSRILHFAVLDKNEFHFEPVNINELVFSVVQQFQMQIDRRNGKIRTELFAMPSVLVCDHNHLEHALSNLVDNALKYSDKTPQICIRTTLVNEIFEISVEDNGIGLSKDEQRMVFERFYRVPTGDRHDVKGFGLGLSYVKAIIDAHLGTIEIRSKKGHGTMFTLKIPLSKEASE